MKPRSTLLDLERRILFNTDLFQQMSGHAVVTACYVAALAPAPESERAHAALKQAIRLCAEATVAHGERRRAWEQPIPEYHRDN